jgi:hypothetical protein
MLNSDMETGSGTVAGLDAKSDVLAMLTTANVVTMIPGRSRKR